MTTTKLYNSNGTKLYRKRKNIEKAKEERKEFEPVGIKLISLSLNMYKRDYQRNLNTV